MFKVCLSLIALCALLPAQGPPIGIIDFYGRQRVPEDKLMKALGKKVGDSLPRSKGDAEEQLEQVEGVVRAHLEAACCEDGKAILYVGIEEKGAPHFDFNAPGAEPAVLPKEIHDEYVAFLAAVGLAVRAGETSEDLSRGHSLMANATCRAHQEKFLALAEAELPRLREVLRKSFDPEHRAIAAYVIGYAPKKDAVIDDLQYALRDPDDTVRNNAMRSLGAMAILAQKQPELELRILPTWFIESLNSIIWQDRITAANTLVTLTESRDVTLMSHLRERALPAIREMAGWKHLPHALPGFILAGRLAGIGESEVQGLWERGDRKALFDKLNASTRPAGQPGRPK
ncbi:MAG TPA: HEAT repeat domain-containing protein [Bryobacteraceae bacterium]|nr:HEAT repeat domain-containing protein [Bryobacteraceae bacterium]